MKDPVTPIKRLGQNFLTDTRIQSKIVQACKLEPTDTVLEIGPGRGALTSHLLTKVKQVIAIEKDRRLAHDLQERWGQVMQIIHGDFLRWDMASIPEGSIVVGNIPYYISTPIIERILSCQTKISRAYLMVQLEFGRRLAAKPGSKEYGSLSCFVQYHADIEVLFKIKAGSFFPKPKVDSCFVGLTMRPYPWMKAQNEKDMFRLIQKAFTQRRKTILNALRSLAPPDELLTLFEKLKIDPQCRPEDLTLLNYIELANNLVLS